MRESAGLLLYRKTGEQLEVLLVHPAGNYNDYAPWSIPNGFAEGTENLEQTARREAEEETGVKAGEVIPLANVVYHQNDKRVYCFTGEAPKDALPETHSWEINRARFMSIDEAKALIYRDQVPFLYRLEELVKEPH